MLHQEHQEAGDQIDALSMPEKHASVNRNPAVGLALPLLETLGQT